MNKITEESPIDTAAKKEILRKFRSALERGTGEAYLLLKRNSSIDFSKEILKGAVRNLSYDNQCEGSRADFIFELIELSSKKEKIRQAILDALANERKDYWALVQLFDLAALFALQGDKEARKAIYKCYAKKTKDDLDWTGQDAILKIDGLEGLKHIAKTRGKILRNNSEEWEDGWMLESFQNVHPEIKVNKELKKASETDSDIKTFLDSVQKIRSKRGPQKRNLKESYATVSKRIEANLTVPLRQVFAKDLTKADVKKLANDFLKETDANKIEKYLKVFAHIKYPYSYLTIFNIARSTKIAEKQLAKAGARALKHFSGNDIREFALEKLSKAKDSATYLELLELNYKKGDYKLITKLVERCKNDDDVHSIVSAVLGIYQTNITKECKLPLEAMYDRLTCGIHRLYIIETLLENKMLSKTIKEEIKYDSYPPIRLLSK
ncbi:MAG: hypothetical protein CFE21_03450 [Bacteroidetes bacterium B1(2017)]|nr:MAG: hypothetical protein CFE21_03450 [Bacteroidetes bacterium B1(2017)]